MSYATSVGGKCPTNGLTSFRSVSVSSEGSAERKKTDVEEEKEVEPQSVTAAPEDGLTSVSPHVPYERPAHLQKQLVWEIMQNNYRCGGK